MEVKKLKRKLTRAIFSEYCDNSTIHGVSYMVDRKRPVAERLSWISAFVLSLIGCGILIHNSWNKWEHSPVITNFNEKSTPVWDIPFPSVTICPETKTKSEIFNVTKVYHDLFNGEILEYATDDYKYFEVISQICLPAYNEYIIMKSNFLHKNCVEIMKRMAPTLKDTFKFCFFRNNQKQCSSLFSETVTEEGICFTFNMYKSDQMMNQQSLHDDYKYIENNKTVNDWNMERGYLPEDNFNESPYRVLGAGVTDGLRLVLSVSEFNMDFTCRGPLHGFKIVLHASDEMPQLSKLFIRVPIDHEVTITVKPQMIITSDTLKNVSPERRQCFFNNERKLKYFKVYSQKNCELECIANFTFAKCGCVKFSMPRSPSQRVCSAKSSICIEEARTDMIVNEFLQKNQKNNVSSINCNCLPSCTSITYETEVSQAAYDWKHTLNSININSSDEEFTGLDLSRLHLSRLLICYKDNKFVGLKRSEFYGQTDFLASCGGLLGLFMGVSILSLFEIFYYFTIRLFCNLRIKNKMENCNDVIMLKNV